MKPIRSTTKPSRLAKSLSPFAKEIAECMACSDHIGMARESYERAKSYPEDEPHFASSTRLITAADLYFLKLKLEALLREVNKAAKNGYPQ